MSAEPEQFPEVDPGVDAKHDVHLAQYWEIVVKRWRLVAIVVGAALVAAFVVSFLATPMYKATVILDVEKDKGSPLDIGQTGVYYDWYQPEFLPTQTRLIRSRTVASKVVRRLGLAERAEFNPESQRKLVSKKSAGGPDVTDKIAKEIQSETEVTPVRGTNLVEVSYTGKSPNGAAEVANAVADSFIEWNLESKYRIVGQASQFLERQIEQLKGEVDDAERKLQMYGRAKDIVSIDPQSNITMQKLESLNRDYTTAVGDRVAKEARYYELANARADNVTDSAAGAAVATMRAEQLKLERDYAEKLSLFKPEWPAMQQLKAQIVKGRQHLEQAIEAAKESAKVDWQTALRREESLKAVLQGQKYEAQTQNSNAIEYNNLKVEVTTKRTLLDSLVKRQSETEVASRLSGQRESNVRVVDRALPPTSRFRPSYRKNGSLGLFLGLTFGLGLAFFLEYMDRTIRNPEQVERHLGLPCLGLIPAIGAEAGKRYGYAYGYGYLAKFYGRKRKGDAAAGKIEPGEKVKVELLPHYFPRSVGSEAYRALRAALLLSRAGGVRTVVVTSGFASEGKTSTAVNLAVVLGQLGKRVLLIDADLHKPRVHKVLMLSNRVGLVSALAEGIEPMKAVQQTNVPFLWAMTAGPLSPNPSGLLASDAMGKLIQIAQANYDYVVLDSPPIQPVADALLLGVQTDGVMLTVKGGKTARDHVARVRDKLLRANVRILGVLINNLSEEASDYVGRRYYYYDREDGYYGEGEKPRKGDSSGTIKKAAQGSTT